MINRDYEVAKRCDLIFQDGFQGYIDSLEYTDDRFTREEWIRIMKEEDGSDDDLTDEEIEGLLDWLEEDGYVISDGEHTAERKGKEMNKDRERQEMDIIAEMREMIALGWTYQEASDQYDAFIARLNGADDLTGNMSKDEILALWKAANETQAEEIAEHFDLATRDDIRAYIGSLEESGMKYSREKWADIIREEAADLDSKLSFAEEAAILDALEKDGFFLNVYMVQEGPRSGNGDYFQEEFEEKAAALDRAESIWGRLTAEERKKTTVEVIANGGTGLTVWKDGQALA